MRIVLIAITAAATLSAGCEPRKQRADEPEEPTRSELAPTGTELDRTQAEIEPTQDELARTRTELERTQDELARTRTEVERTLAELERTRAELADVQQQVERTREQARVAEQELAAARPQIAASPGAQREPAGAQATAQVSRQQAARSREPVRSNVQGLPPQEAQAPGTAARTPGTRARPPARARARGDAATQPAPSTAPRQWPGLRTATGGLAVTGEIANMSAEQIILRRADGVTLDLIFDPLRSDIVRDGEAVSRTSLEVGMQVRVVYRLQGYQPIADRIEILEPE